MTNPHRHRLVAIVVTYNPQLEILRKLLDVLIFQVESVVMVDNGSDVDLEEWTRGLGSSSVEVIHLHSNRGIAVAQNCGIVWARSHGAEFVLLMDQDSIPAPDMVNKLISVVSKKELAAVAGPRYLDERQNNPPPFIRFRGLRLERCSCLTEETILPVDYLIASGCLIPMSVLDKVGGMREDLFIDYVDIEWGLRARHYGFQSYGVCSAHMQHSLGDHPIKFFGKIIPSHSPIRHYYHFRNAVFLFKESWVPLNWKLVDGWRLCLKYVFFSLYAKPRLAHFRMMTLGLWHGLVGKAGKFKEDA